ncbi:MAG: DNA alkylation repair protein [Fibrobacteraceae bacterium]|nr:DNA alkylation repair protein [Fibrobacteraceae bacterium]
MLRFTQEILLALRAKASEDEAHEMAKGVRDSFDFLGVKVVTRREATYPIFDKYPPKNGDELATRVSDMWGQSYRELQYAACDYLFRYKVLLGGQHLNFLKSLIKTRPWKDTVDTIATSILGDLAWRIPTLRNKIAAWIRDPNIWVRRSVIIFQLQYRDHTDWDLLKSFCIHCAQDENYYIRNGIGRALSEYARINPTEVRHFIMDTQFSPLTSQEVLRNI